MEVLTRAKRLAPSDLTYFSQEIAAVEECDDCSESLLTGLFANFGE